MACRAELVENLFSKKWLSNLSPQVDCDNQQTQVFEGNLPKAENPSHHGEKLHQVFLNTKTNLENILSGYCLPDPYFSDRLQRDINTLMKCLRDPALPLYELQVDFLCCSLLDYFMKFAVSRYVLKHS